MLRLALCAIMLCIAGCGSSAGSDSNLRITSINLPRELTNSDFVQIVFEAEVIFDTSGNQLAMPPPPDRATVSVTRGQLYRKSGESYQPLGVKQVQMFSTDRDIYWLPSTDGHSRRNATLNVSGANTLKLDCHIESVVTLAGAGQ